MTNIKKKFALVGYDKDHDVYDVIDTYATEKEAFDRAKSMRLDVNGNYAEYRSSAGDPYDWFEVYKNFDSDAEVKLHVV